MRVYENICTGQVGEFRVRVWFARDALGPSAHVDAARLKAACADQTATLLLDPMVLAGTIASGLPFVNAIEVVRHDPATGAEYGSLVYPEWP